MAWNLLDGMAELGKKAIGGGSDEPAIDDKVKEEWNKYTSWLEEKGMKGKPELDSDQLGFKMLDEYRKANPNTILSKDLILPIQREFQTYRQKALENIKTGKATFNGKEEDFMPGLSKLDGYPGRYTTSYKFPSATVTTLDNGIPVEKKIIPFAPTDITQIKK
jgi:hypothetical protein